MKKLLFILYTLYSLGVYANHNIKIYTEKINNGYKIYADNSEYCPMTVSINFNLLNLKKVPSTNQVYVLKANRKRQLLTTLKVVNLRKRYQFNFKYFTNYGNHTQKTYDRDYSYSLPFTKGKKFRLAQGYNGNISHYGESKNSLDFTMPIGTEITAIRNGIVIKVIEKYNKNCLTKACAKFGNIILIYHSDGTFAEYVHLKQDGAIVKVGDQVSKGQIIGLSGNTGWSTGPHLHLRVYNQFMNSQKSLKTKFRVGNGNKSQFLVERKMYFKNY